TTSAFVSMFAALSVFAVVSTNGGLQLTFGLQGWLAVIGIVLFSTVLAIGCFFRGLQLIGSTKASILSMVEPVVTISCSAILLHERLTWLQAFGGMIVLLGAVLIVASRGKQEKAIEPAVGQPLTESRE
ncbi:DMT family transporter, partial [Microbacteriaceae bacterium K1510]|nr:DMT family transporter [Microbacteriaceae bacterium K1510]